MGVGACAFCMNCVMKSRRTIGSSAGSSSGALVVFFADVDLVFFEIAAALPLLFEAAADLPRPPPLDDILRTGGMQSGRLCVLLRSSSAALIYGGIDVKLKLLQV